MVANYKEMICSIALNMLKRKIPFAWDLNIYRGCEHGCKYCYAMYSHQYLDSQQYFNDIYVKTNVVEQLEKQHIPFEFKWDAYRAIEYHTGIAFCVYDTEEGVRIADGGGYHNIVNTIDNRIFSCYSFACSLESVVQHIFSRELDQKNAPSVCHVMNFGTSFDYFAETCSYLRSIGIPVKEYWSETSPKKFLSKLSSNDNHCIIGLTEETTRAIRIQNFSDKTDTKEIFVPKK
jgi:histidyl-tRNA synthetase